MAKKNQPNLPKEDQNLSFEDVKEMTVGQIERKQQDLKDGIEETDGVLDRYIKQHREAIEAEKFDTIVQSTTIPAAIQELEKPPVVKESTEESRKEPVVEPSNAMPSQSSEADKDFLLDEEEEESSKKKLLVWSALAMALIGLLAAAYLGLRSADKGASKKSETPSEVSNTTSSSAENKELTAFETLYASFFTDGSLSKLRNDRFNSLPELKAALDKMDASSQDYKKAKEKYDALEKAIKATKAINAQFDKPAIQNGELDTTAKVKADAKFTAVETGIGAIDTLLASAINYGRTQAPAPSDSDSQDQASAVTPSDASQAPAQAAPVQAAPAQEAPAATPAAPSNPASLSNGLVLDYGKRIVYGSEGVALQRDLSRVPYDDTVIADAGNQAWVFNPGVLENIIATSNQRGYFAGNDFILEKVNIIKGNGYYNLFKSDGTYLFSINAKTGYFVGNGPGYADGLDF